MATLTKIPDMHIWSQCIGGLIINFGIIEFQTFRWMQVLVDDSESVKCQDKFLGKRIDRVIKLIKSSSMPSDIKEQSKDLWLEAKDLAISRNRIAHNPIAMGKTKNNELSLNIIDLKKMLPTGAKLEPLNFTHVESMALRAGERINLIYPVK